MKKVYCNFLVLIFFAMVVMGCTSTVCKPTLFPYVEYSFKAEPKKLVGSITKSDKDEIIEFQKLKFIKPNKWTHEFPLDNTLQIFTEGKKRSIIISYNKSRSFDPDGFRDMNLIGCDNFEAKNGLFKSSKDFISDVFLFTEEELKGMKKEPTFWHYFILWSKSTSLHGAERLVHYKGKNVEAFRMDKKIVDAELHTIVDLFHKKLEPNYFSISTNFSDDAFIENYIDMVDILN